MRNESKGYHRPMVELPLLSRVIANEIPSRVVYICRYKHGLPRAIGQDNPELNAIPAPSFVSVVVATLAKTDLLLYSGPSSRIARRTNLTLCLDCRTELVARHNATPAARYVGTKQRTLTQRDQRIGTHPRCH
jgi:hypothetical protein